MTDDQTAPDASPAETTVTDPLSPAAADHRTDLPVDDTPAPVAPLAGVAPVKPDSPAFSDFDIKPEIVAALAEVGITRTFAIQELTLPIALEGKDLIGQARTGSGKTLGFGVPLLNRISVGGASGALPQALVVAPTRELAVQVSADLQGAGTKLGARVLTIYGGRAYEPQIEALRKGVDVVVGTPGRLLDLAEQGHLNLSAARILVLDEADEMLDLGFLPDIEKLLRLLPAARQTMLFSATMPGPIVALARQFLIQPIQIRAEQDSARPNISHIRQFAYRAHAMDKAELLARILQSRERGLALIFTRTKRTAQKVSDDLEDRGFAAAAIHGDLGQGAREQALRAFRSGKVDVLVATDVAARGLDVEGISHVVNYQAPEDTMTYVHRIGRTARAGREGTAVTFVDWDDVPRWQLLCKDLDLPFGDPAETYSTSPHVYAELDIPEGTKGTLPRSQRTRAGLDAEVVEDLGGRAPSRGRDGADRDGRGAGGRGDRSRGRSPGGRSDAGRPDGGAESRPAEGTAPRTPRTRTRTRGGGAAAAASGAGDPTTGTAEATSGDPTATSAPARRRRSRGGRGRGGQGGATQNDTTRGTVALDGDGVAGQTD